jgi:hypothetical protein
MTDLFNKQDPFSNFNSANKKKYQKPNNLIEAFRDQGSAATRGVASSFIDQLTGKDQFQNTNSNQNQQEQKPQSQPFNFAEFLKQRENRIRQQERMLSQQQQKTERVLFFQKEDKAKQEIEIIKAEIKKIIISTQDVSAELIEAEKTVATTTVEVGTYQINFFQRIRKLLILAKKRIEESRHWLELYNQRNAHRSYYWGQVKKSGSKFMLSQERQISNQTG